MHGTNCLETGPINTKVLDWVGATKVAGPGGTGGLSKVSMEQVLVWNPYVLIDLDSTFLRSEQTDPLWSSVKADRDKRVISHPNFPMHLAG